MSWMCTRGTSLQGVGQGRVGAEVLPSVRPRSHNLLLVLVQQTRQRLPSPVPIHDFCHPPAHPLSRVGLILAFIAFTPQHFPCMPR